MRKRRNKQNKSKPNIVTKYNIHLQVATCKLQLHGTLPTNSDKQTKYIGSSYPIAAVPTECITLKPNVLVNLALMIFINAHRWCLFNPFQSFSSHQVLICNRVPLGSEIWSIIELTEIEAAVASACKPGQPSNATDICADKITHAGSPPETSSPIHHHHPSKHL